MLTNMKYTREHEWIRMEGGDGVVGITRYATDQLGDIVYVELPEVGRELQGNESFGVVESVKNVSDLFCPVAGTVIAVNADLIDKPELVNQDPFGAGWMIRIRLKDPLSLDLLLDGDTYKAYVEAL